MITQTYCETCKCDTCRACERYAFIPCAIVASIQKRPLLPCRYIILDSSEESDRVRMPIIGCSNHCSHCSDYQKVKVHK